MYIYVLGYFSNSMCEKKKKEKKEKKMYICIFWAISSSWK